MSEHARLSPSNHKWVYCPGSIREEAKYPYITNSAAIDGTGSHLLLELCLNTGRPVQEYLNEYIGIGHKDKGSGWHINQNRIERVQTCIDYVEKRKKELLKEYSFVVVKTESKSNPGLKYKRDDWWGTVDVTIFAYSSESKIPTFIEVIDLKDGQRFVDVNDNPQLIAYMGGKIYEYLSFKMFSTPIRMTIVQPKTKPPIRYVDSEVGKLLIKLNQIAIAAKKTDDKNAPLIPDGNGGKGYCKWCKHRDNCEARKNQIIGKLKEMTNDVNTNGISLFEVINQTFKNIEDMGVETLSQMLDAKAAIDDIFKRAEEEATRRLENGDFIPGYSMLPSNSRREWDIEEEELVKKLKTFKLKKDDIYISKLISPAQIMSHNNLTKKQKERIENDYIKIIPGALKLKKVSIKKQENPVDMFRGIVKQCNTKLNNISFI